MQVVKATKTFRIVSLWQSMIFSLVSILLLLMYKKDCSKSNLKVTTGLIFFLWSAIFVILLIQVARKTDCLRAIRKLLFAFYFFVSAVMFFVQMQLFGGVNNDCRDEAPTLYWWLVTNIILFYVIVAFGLATWGSYLCKVAQAQDEITKEAV